MREGTEPPEDGPPAGEPPPPSSQPAAPVEPVAPSPGPGSDRGSIARSIALGVVGFAATILVLGGLFSLSSRSPAGAAQATATTPPSVETGTAAPSAGSSGSLGATASGPPTDAVLVGAGDIADCSLDKGAATATLLDGIAGTVFTAGDNAYSEGTTQQFADCYDPTWGRHRSRTRPAAGNHDWGTRDLAGYLGYFGTAAAPDGKSWYSYDLGAWHVIVLDSDCDQVKGCGPDSEQGKWLAADLAAARTKCTAAIWHHPRFSSGEHGNDDSVAPFWKALYDAGADIVINGHDHDYERFAPQDPEGRADDARGIREFVAGTGGAALRMFPTTRPNSLVRASVAHGVLRFTLHQTGYDWRFISTTGEFSDSGAGACH